MITCQRTAKISGHPAIHTENDQHTGNTLLHRELCLHLNRHIRHGRVLMNIRLWTRVHEIQIGVTQKEECFLKRWTFDKQINNRNSFSKTCILNFAHSSDRIKPVGGRRPVHEAAWTHPSSQQRPSTSGVCPIPGWRRPLGTHFIGCWWMEDDKLRGQKEGSIGESLST